MVKDIDMGAFLDLLAGAVVDGDNREFWIDTDGIESRVLRKPDKDYERVFGPLTTDKKEAMRRDYEHLLGLLTPTEKRGLRQFNKEVRLDFPCSLDEVKAWSADIIGVKPDDIDRRYRRLKGRSPPRRAGRPPAYIDAHFDCVEKFMREDGVTQAEACRETAKLYFPDEDPHSKGENMERALRKRRT